MRKGIIAWLLPVLLVFTVGVQADKHENKININQATVEELDEGLKGVGERIAREIVRHREEHGPFKSFQDLDEVKFVGRRVIKNNKHIIVFRDAKDEP